MRVLFPDPTYDHEESYPPERFAADLKREARAISADHTVQERNLGRGADWPMFVIAFAVLFASGKKLNDNLEGWIALALKLRGFCAWIGSKCVSQWVDEEASALLGLGAVAESHHCKIESIELVSSIFVPSAEVLLASGDLPDFQPVGIYIHAYQVNHAITYAVVVRSTGAIEASVAVAPDNPFEQ